MSAVNTAEVAGLMYKLERAENELAQVRLDMEKFREEARIARHQLTLTEKALEQSELTCKEQKECISKLQQEVASYESLKQRSQTAVAGLQKVARESQDHVIKLETRLRQLLERQDNTIQAANQESSENHRFMQQVARRLGVLEDKLEGSELLENLGKRLDKAALLEVQHAQTEMQLNKALRDLQSMQTSTEQLTKRYEENLTDRKILGEKLDTINAEKSDLHAQFLLLQTSMRAKDKQLTDLRKQLQDLNSLTQTEKEKTRKTVFDLEVEKVQLKSLVDFLAASLSTVDQPCPANEAAVKQAVQKLLEQVKMLKEVGAGFEQKVLQFQRQFESQMKSGIVASEEMKTMRQRMRELESDKAQMESELLGLKILVQNDGHNKTQLTELLGKLVQRLGFQLEHTDKSNTELLIYALDGLERLLSRGCLSQSCLDHNFKPDVKRHGGHSPNTVEPWDSIHQHSHPTNTHCSSPTRSRPAHANQDMVPTVTSSYFCNHQSLAQLIGTVFRNEGRLDNDQQNAIRHLCDKCANSLTLAVCSQLCEVYTQLRDVRGTAARVQLKDDRCAGVNNEVLARLQMDYEAEHEKVLTLTKRIAQLEQDKKTEIAELNETVERLEKSRLVQAKRMDKISRHNDKDNVIIKHKLDALRTAKQLLIETQQKKARLSDCFALLGRLLNVDTRFDPNAELLILQRVQQLIELVHRLGLTTFAQPNTVAYWPVTSGPWNNEMYTRESMAAHTAPPLNPRLPLLQNGNEDAGQRLKHSENRVSFEELQFDGMPLNNKPSGNKIIEIQRAPRSHSASLSRINTSTAGLAPKSVTAKSSTVQSKLKIPPNQHPRTVKRDERKY